MMMFTASVSKFQKMNDVTGLMNCLDSKRASIRYSAFNALSGINNPDDTIINRLKKMINDKSAMVKTAATLKLAGMGESSASVNFIDIIVDGSRDEQIELLNIITHRGKSEDETVLQVIMHGLHDKKEPV